MMRKYLVLIAILMSFYSVHSQNMVYDGSFEEYIHLPTGYSSVLYKINPLEIIEGDILTNCLCHRPDSTSMIYPFGIGRYNICKGWFNPSYSLYLNKYATSDYFNRSVNPFSNFNFARYADVPNNLGNATQLLADPIVPKLAAQPFHGDGYTGMAMTRGATNYMYTEYIAQRLNNTNPENYLREGGIYDISFRVKKSNNYNTTGHSL